MRALRTTLMLSLLVAGSVHAEEIVIQTSDDTWIEDLDDTSNHGNELATAICPTANYWIYLKFDLGALVGTLNAAEVRMTRINGSRPEEISVYRITDDSWTETTLTGVGRPAPTNPPNATSLGTGDEQTGYDRWTSPAISSMILSEAAGDGTLSLMFREDPSAMLDIRYYRTKEASVPEANKPQLVLDLSPDEVMNLVVGDGTPTRLFWAPGSGSMHDVAGGTLSDLRADGGVDAAICLIDDLAGANYQDTRPDPAPGDGYYYIARAQIGLEAGSYGFDSSGSPRTPLGACS